MTQVLNLYFFITILIMCYIPKVSKGTENKFKMKTCYHQINQEQRPTV